MNDIPDRALNGLRIATLADEYSDAASTAIQRLGGTLLILDLDLQPSVHDASMADLANRILTADFDVALFLTGAGTRSILERAIRLVPRQRFLDGLRDIATVAGSPQAGAVLKHYDIHANLVVQPAVVSDPTSYWRDVLLAIDRQVPVVNQSVAIESTGSVSSLCSGLESRGARVTTVPPFRHAFPVQPQKAIAFFEQIDAGDFDAMLFNSPGAAAQFIFLAEHYARVRFVRHLLDDFLVLVRDDGTGEVLQSRDVAIDYHCQSTDVEHCLDEIAGQISTIRSQNATIRATLSGPASSSADPRAPWYNSPFMQACRGEPTDVTPIWMMRQAGRYMAEYRAVRDKVSFLELCANPQLCSEVMCTAVNRLGVDAAIIFSDLLPILVPMGCDLEFVHGDGPVIHNPVRTTADIDRIRPLESNAPLQFVMDTVRQTRNDLPADMPLIGFAGAPFTLASYMIEGGASRNYAHTKALMFGDRGGWNQIMQHLTDSISRYLLGQIEAGAQCVQLFDSWAGCLGFEDYRRYVHPFVKQIIDAMPASVPVINFATGNPALLPLLADTRASVIGIDWRVRLDDAWQTVGYDRAVQGNLDPTVLLTNPAEIRRQAKLILDQAGSRPGHIFNLGHGILPNTPVDHAIALVDAVHELSS